MLWQLIIVGVVVAVAAFYLVRQTWRTWTARKRGCGDCGCARPASPTSQTLIPLEQLTLRHKNDR